VKIMCVKCGKQLKCKKNEVIVEESADNCSYRIWEADLWKCPKCGTEIIAGFGSEPMAEHFEKDYRYQQVLAGLKERVKVYQLES